MQFRELLAERDCGEPLALFDDIRRAHRGPDPHEQMEMIELHSEFHNRPALLVTRLANQLLAAFANLVHQHLAPAFGAPDEVVDNQMHMVFVALVVQVAQDASRVDIPPQYLQRGKRQDFWRKPTHARTSAWPKDTAAVQTIL